MKKLLITSALLILSVLNYGQRLPDPPGGVEIKEDNSSLTVGMRFVPKKKAVVSGARYYTKAPAVGLTTAQLWTISGILLATADFAPGSGWISVNFSSPVLVDSTKEYVITYSNVGGYYTSSLNFFPFTCDQYSASGSLFSWYAKTFPSQTWEQSNYYIEPLITALVQPTQPPPPTSIIRDTIRILVDTCSIDYTKINNMDFTFVLALPELDGGSVRLPDSTSVYQAIYGAMQPHIAFKETAPRMYRFTRSYVINKVTTSVRFTLYKSGAWIREKKNAAGVYEIWPYAPY